ncbi:hypothetical protein A5881_001243 [Enterococcus termitis]|nr:hypothetical protein A5881_003025 [Enterococcus termitis]
MNSMSFNDLLHQNYNQLSETDFAISKFIMENKNEIGNLGVTVFAKKSLSSKSSVIRFSQKLGFTGYSEMKNYLKWEASADPSNEKHSSFFTQTLQDVEETLKYIREADWTELYQVIEKCARIFVISTGVTQQNQAAELQRMFLLIGKPVQVIPGSADSVEFKRIVEQLAENDVIFLLSLSGENRSLDGILNILKIKRALIVSITNFKSNWLSGQATYNLYASSSRSPIPNDWWLQSASSFFTLVEAFAFGYIDYQRKVSNNNE